VSTSTGTGGPLRGLRVLELGQYISGPFAGKLLADMGADVIKVESPEGDPMRRWEGTHGSSPQFAAYNRNKRGVVLDLKTDADVAILRDMVREADVLIENFRPGVTRRLGIDHGTTAGLNPRLVHCSITGFGPTGPYASRPAYDTVISAMGGMYSQVVPAGVLRPLGPAFSDLLAGQSAVHGILAALHARDRDGAGQLVEVSMLGALMDFLTESVSTYLSSGATTEPDTRPRRAQAYACLAADDRAFVVHMSVPEKFWHAVLEVFERPDLATDPRFATREGRVRHYDALDAILKQEARRLPRDAWLERLTGRDIPHGPLNTMAGLLSDPQVASLDLLLTTEAPDGARVTVPRYSTRFHGSGRPDYRPAPDLQPLHPVGVGDGPALDVAWREEER
jgi:formyl-CoA transferase